MIWTKFGLFRGYYLGQVGVIIWAKVFLAYCYSGFKRCSAHAVSFCVLCCPVFRQLCKLAFSAIMCQNCFFFTFSCFEFDLKISLFGLAKHNKIGVIRFFFVFLSLKEKQ